MAVYIDYSDPRYAESAAEILRRHDNFEPEANITSAVRDFLILTGLARSEEMVEGNPPSEASRRAVDLIALDTFIEFERRIGTAAGSEPDPEKRQATGRLPTPIGVARPGSDGRSHRRQAVVVALARTRRGPFSPPLRLHLGWAGRVVTPLRVAAGFGPRITGGSQSR